MKLNKAITCLDPEMAGISLMFLITSNCMIITRIRLMMEISTNLITNSYSYTRLSYKKYLKPSYKLTKKSRGHI